jgi:hypothetical protein
MRSLWRFSSLARVCIGVSNPAITKQAAPACDWHVTEVSQAAPRLRGVCNAIVQALMRLLPRDDRSRPEGGRAPVSSASASTLGAPTVSLSVRRGGADEHSTPQYGLRSSTTGAATGSRDSSAAFIVTHLDANTALSVGSRRSDGASPESTPGRPDRSGEDRAAAARGLEKAERAPSSSWGTAVARPYIPLCYRRNARSSASGQQQPGRAADPASMG